MGKRAARSRSPRLTSSRTNPIPRPSRSGNHRSQPSAQRTCETSIRCRKRPLAEAQNHAPDPATSRCGTQFCIKCKRTDLTADCPWIKCGPKDHLCQSAMHLQCFSPPRQRAPRATWWCPTCKAMDKLRQKKVFIIISLGFLIMRPRLGTVNLSPEPAVGLARGACALALRQPFPSHRRVPRSAAARSAAKQPLPVSTSRSRDR